MNNARHGSGSQSARRGNTSGKPADLRPNIILIFPDEWRWDCIGALRRALAMEGEVQTPNVDRIANSGGVIFSNAYTCGPLCMPGRASMMTGLYVHEHGLWVNNDTWHYDKKKKIGVTPTNYVSEYSHVYAIKNSGYHTALIGKHHLNGPLTDANGVIPDWGFEDTVEVSDGDSLIVYDRWYNSPWANSIGINKYKQYLAYWWNVFKTNNDRKDPWYTPPLDLKNLPKPDPRKKKPYTGTYDLDSPDHYDTFVGDQAVKWIDDYTDSQCAKPFYLQVNFPGPHYPENATTDYRNRINVANLGLSILEPFPDGYQKPPLVQASINKCDIQDMNSYDNALLRQIYFANILMVDDGIGKILDTLQKTGLDKNTWIFFCSDHGEMLGDHHLMYKLVFYESATKVPLIVRPPCPEVFPQGFPPHWISAGLTDHLDLTASILDLAGLQTKANHGASLLPKIANGPADSNAQKGKDCVISEIFDEQATDNNVAYHQLMLRTDTDTEKYKLNVELNSPTNSKKHYTVNKAVEFYNLAKDPDELHNILQDPVIDPVYSAAIAKMKDQINTVLKNALKVDTTGNGAP